MALSASSWLASRPRPAPSAARIASSARRPSPRINSRFATLAVAMSRTNATAARSASIAGLVSPTMTLWNGRTIGVNPFGTFLVPRVSNSRVRDVSSAVAWSIVTPGLSRAIMSISRRAASPNVLLMGTDRVVLHASTPRG